MEIAPGVFVCVSLNGISGQGENEQIFYVGIDGRQVSEDAFLKLFSKEKLDICMRRQYFPIAVPF